MKVPNSANGEGKAPGGQSPNKGRAQVQGDRTTDCPGIVVTPVPFLTTVSQSYLVCSSVAFCVAVWSVEADQELMIV